MARLNNWHSWRQVVLLSLALIIVAVYPLAGTQRAAAQSGPLVQPLSPTNNSTVSGKLTFRFRVANIAPSDFETFWSVDNGTWNRMAADPQDPAVAQSIVDVSGWNWQSSHQYTLSFIALQTSTWQPIIQNVPIVVGAGPSAGISADPSAAVARIVASQTRLFTDQNSDVAVNALKWGTTHPADDAAMRYLASQPIANWYGDWNGNVQAEVDSYVTRAASANSVPMLVAYNLPHRDCGSYSAGGANSEDAYSQWITSFAKGIGQRNALVILEPDSLAQLDCLSSADQAQRDNMLKNAVQTLQKLTNASVYLDAGNPNWQSVATMAARLNAADLAEADGFSLNVSNFETTDKNVTYGTQISKLTNNKHFIIDTSRNGSGQANDASWCNPVGRTVGAVPTLNTGNSLVDANLWIKIPGASDGSCGSAEQGTSPPPAGAWWPEYAISLLRSVPIQ